MFFTGSGTDPKKKPRTPPKSSVDSRGRGQTGDKYWQGARQRWNFKLLGQSLTETMSQWLTSEVKPVYVEQFVPPSTTLLEYFIHKVQQVRRWSSISSLRFARSWNSSCIFHWLRNEMSGKCLSWKHTLCYLDILYWDCQHGVLLNSYLLFYITVFCLRYV